MFETACQFYVIVTGFIDMNVTLLFTRTHNL